MLPFYIIIIIIIIIIIPRSSKLHYTKHSKFKQSNQSLKLKEFHKLYSSLVLGRLNNEGSDGRACITHRGVEMLVVKPKREKAAWKKQM
jgi:hypothetical protein